MKQALALVVLIVAWPVVKVITWWDEAVMAYERLEEEIRKD